MQAIFRLWRRESAGPRSYAGGAAIGYDLDGTPDDIRTTYRFSETCQETVPQARVNALTESDYEDAIRNAISIGGDSATVAAIAGGVAEALFGIPEEIGQKGWTYLAAEMRSILQALYR